MSKYIKALVSSLPLLFALVGTSASASSVYNPDGGDTGGCNPAYYINNDWYENASFYVPALQNNQYITVYTTAFRENGSTYQTSAEFECHDGTLSGSWGYPPYEYWEI
jgi:hypothetical protein